VASNTDIAIVRNNIAEQLDVAPFTTAYIGGLVDGGGVSVATLTLWRQKAAGLSSAVDVTEAGASHKFSDRYKNALEQIKYWQGIVDGEGAQLGPRVVKIERIS
jgi:hypothetical protein